MEKIIKTTKRTLTIQVARTFCRKVQGANQMVYNVDSSQGWNTDHQLQSAYKAQYMQNIMSHMFKNKILHGINNKIWKNYSMMQKNVQIAHDVWGQDKDFVQG